MSFTPTSPPRRGGDYTRFAIKRSSALPPSTGSVVAIPFVTDWGPLKVPTPVDSYAEFLQVFGPPLDPANPSEGHVAVYNAFRGEGDDAPGAGRVIAYRHAGSAAAKATKVLAAGATPSALVLTALYEGARGNNLKVAVVANAADPTNARDILIYEGTLLLESYTGYLSSTITQAAIDINAQSAYVRANTGTNGTKLDALAATAFASGNSGTSMVIGDWTDAGTGTIAMLEPQQFGYFAPANLTDATILAALVAWNIAKNGADKAKRFFLVYGGALNEVYATAKARALLANTENCITWGVGSYKDSAITAAGLTMSTAQLAPRLAGILAARRGTSALSFAYLQDLSIVAGPAEADILDAMDNGVVVVGLGSGGTRFERGVTTYTTKSDANKPFATYSRIKYVTTMQNFERDGKEANESGDVLGKLNVNNDTREFLVGREQKRLDQYIERGEVQPGAKVFLTQDPPPSDLDEYVAVDWQGQFERTLEQVRRTVYFS